MTTGRINQVNRYMYFEGKKKKKGGRASHAMGGKCQKGNASEPSQAGRHFPWFFFFFFSCTKSLANGRDVPILQGNPRAPSPAAHLLRHFLLVAGASFFRTKMMDRGVGQQRPLSWKIRA